MAPKPVTLTRQVRIELPVERVWQILSQTSKVNHAVGLPALTFSERTNPNGQREIVGATHKFGFSIHWVEQPFEWVTQQYSQVERVFERTPFLRSLVTGSRIQADTPSSTIVESFTIMYPRDIVGKIMGRFLVGKLVNDHVLYLQGLAAKVAANQTDYFPPARRVKTDGPTLVEMTNRLRNLPVNQPILDRLLTLIRTGRDEDVATMRPFVLADEWGVNRLETLRLFLYATQAGLLDMNWDVLCPNCRVSQETTSSLRDLNKTAHCDVCHISYDTNFDEYVELRFAVNSNVRQASSVMYCAMGSPALNQHIVAQQRLAAGETRSLSVAVEIGGYNVRMLGSEQRCTLRIDPALTTTQATITLTANGVAEAAAECAPGAVTLTCVNTSASEQLLIVERDAWGSARVSAALVTTLPEFRTLFSSEVLAPGLGMAIKNLTILFSDIKNSTPMYEQFGDSSAYAVVRDHFTTLFAAIEQHEGSVVKTVGDAVMAVFSNPVEAVAAALDIHTAIDSSNAERPDRPPLSIKIGLHCGPCIAVNANEVLDYFGTTVNAAARAQSVSVGGDTIITDDVMHIAGVEKLLASRNLEIERFTRDLKGLSQAYTLYRLKPLEQAKQVSVE
jgi:class 3 adenylate cyclase